ncbi:hypothetical protein CB1_000273032, partial [Camelus ferus]
MNASRLLGVLRGGHGSLHAAAFAGARVVYWELSAFCEPGAALWAFSRLVPPLSFGIGLWCLFINTKMFKCLRHGMLCAPDWDVQQTDRRSRSQAVVFYEDVKKRFGGGSEVASTTHTHGVESTLLFPPQRLSYVLCRPSAACSLGGRRRPLLSPHPSPHHSAFCRARRLCSDAVWSCGPREGTPPEKPCDPGGPCLWLPVTCLDLSLGLDHQLSCPPDPAHSAAHCEVVQRLLGLREMEKALGGGLGLHSLEANEGPQQDRREPLLVRVARRTDHSGFCHCKGTASAPGLGSSTVPPRRKCTKRAEGGRL